jgi:hypothetical protein
MDRYEVRFLGTNGSAFVDARDIYVRATSLDDARLVAMSAFVGLSKASARYQIVRVTREARK